MIFDLTQEFKNQLNGYPQESIQQYFPSKIPPFLKLYVTYSEDIYQKLLRIKMILTENRENYFSNASFSFEAFTQRQREQLNENIKSSLQNVLSQINELQEGLKNRFDSRRKTEEEHMKSVVICLYQLLKEIEKSYVEFEEFSLKRKKKIQETISIDKTDEKGKYQTRIPQPMHREVTDAELQRESGLLIVEKISKQKEFEQYKKKIQNLHELMSTMSNVVLEQQLKTSAFLQIGETGLFHIERGNKNLVQANMLAKATGKWWSLLFIAMALSLLTLDFLKS